jgi:hypothetical protein
MTMKGGSDLLISAIVHRDEAAARTLLEAGADPNAVGQDGEAPMLAAAIAHPGGRPGAPSDEGTRFLSLLLDHGGDPNLRDERGEPLLLTVILYLRFDSAHLLLDRGADIDATNAMGETAVFRLASLNQFEEVNFFLDRGASPDCKDATGRTLRDVVAKSRVDPASPAARWRERVAARLAG